METKKIKMVTIGESAYDKLLNRERKNKKYKNVNLLSSSSSSSDKTEVYNNKHRKYSNTDAYSDNNVTDSMTWDEIKKRIVNYNQIAGEDLKNMPTNTKIRYFEILENGKYRYKPGGTVIVNKYPDYLVLSNGTNRTWSVQLNKHIIFMQMDIDEIKNRYEQILIEKNKKIDQYRHYIEKLLSENEQLKKAK